MKNVIYVLVLGAFTQWSHSACATGASKNPARLENEINLNGVMPAELDSENYISWLTPALKGSDGRNSISPFTAKIFKWYKKEKNSELPKEVAQDPNKILVNVATARAETEQMEEAEAIDKNTVIGAEVYSELDGSMDDVLQAMAYRWGKPVNEDEGKTHPAADPYKKRVEYFAPVMKWAPGANLNLSMRREGSFVDPMTDRYLFLVRGNKATGFDLFMQYLGPAGKTSTKSCFAIAILRPLADGRKVAFKISTRYIGQSYGLLGSFGKTKIGFNEKKAREMQLSFVRQLKELVDSGKIEDQPGDDLEYNRDQQN